MISAEMIFIEMISVHIISAQRPRLPTSKVSPRLQAKNKLWKEIILKEMIFADMIFADIISTEKIIFLDNSLKTTPTPK